MVTPNCHFRRGSAAGRALARRGQRGMAVMVVVLVIMMLTGIGIFSTRAASLTTAAAGSMRQMSQTHYVAEYAMQSAFAEFASARQQGYMQLLSNSSTANNKGDGECPTLVGVPNKTCLKLTKADLETILKVQNGSAQFLVNANGATPGSLGGGDVANVSNIANFAIEITDLSPVASPVAGSDVASSGGAAMSFYMVTLSATGMVVPNPVAGSLDDTNSFKSLSDKAGALSASQELSRAHVIVGPLPAKL